MHLFSPSVSYLIGCGNEDVVMSTGGTGQAAGASDVNGTADGSTGAKERTRRYAELLSKQRDVASAHTHLDKVHLLIHALHSDTLLHVPGTLACTPKVTIEIYNLHEAEGSGKVPLATLCSRCFAGEALILIGMIKMLRELPNILTCINLFHVTAIPDVCIKSSSQLPVMTRFGGSLPQWNLLMMRKVTPPVSH